MDDQLKVCTKCNIEKPITEFNNNKNWCKLCEKEYKKQYYEKNKEKIKKRINKYREQNPEKVREANQKYKEKNRQLLREKQRIYYYNNREELLEKHKDYMLGYNKQYYEDNKDELLTKKKEYHKQNKEKIKAQRKIYEKENRKQIQQKHNEYVKVYNKNRKATDKLFKLTLQVRGVIYDSFTKKGYTKKSNTYKILGTDYETFYYYLLQTFKDNYGYEWDGKEKVHIDHIIPLATATTEDEVLKLCNYKNLQLLKAKDNLLKKDRLDFKLDEKE